MRYVTGPTRSSVYPTARRYGLGRPGLGDSEFDPDWPIVQWFERRQRAGWCELYPHVLSLYSAGSKLTRYAGMYDAVASNLAITSLYPELAEKAAEAAANCRDLAKDCRTLQDFLYAVKDYVLGAEFGREGSSFEEWCRSNVQPKSIEQLSQEAEGMGLGGLGRSAGLGIAPLLVAGITIVSITGAIYVIGWVLDKVLEHQRVLDNVKRCGDGDKRACARADKDAGAVNQSKLNVSEKPDTAESIASMVKWLAVGVVGVFAYKAFTQSKFAVTKAKDAPPSPEQGTP